MHDQHDGDVDARAHFFFFFFFSLFPSLSLSLWVSRTCTVCCAGKVDTIDHMCKKKYMLTHAYEQIPCVSSSSSHVIGVLRSFKEFHKQRRTHSRARTCTHLSGDSVKHIHVCFSRISLTRDVHPFAFTVFHPPSNTTTTSMSTGRQVTGMDMADG